MLLLALLSGRGWHRACGSSGTRARGQALPQPLLELFHKKWIFFLMLASPSLIMGGLRVPWGHEEPLSVSRAGSKGCQGLGKKLAQVGKYIPGFPWIFHSPDPQGTNTKK